MILLTKGSGAVCTTFYWTRGRRRGTTLAVEQSVFHTGLERLPQVFHLGNNSTAICFGVGRGLPRAEPPGSAVRAQDRKQVPTSRPPQTRPATQRKQSN